ncbi:ammonium transporter Rh type A-like [Xenopus laevis]|uniref:Ammonium transporter AmtB-like domain-containing protein n=2 Tax=Xenopus laevis TaxID=8355 RepID=A0A974BXB7_XENLA|nr:ammonium transporter Rh type A-like [Xenopus laevis]OCT62528.1 hypothetical protein XELAEV_18043611mg [Xenopus laevis]
MSIVFNPSVRCQLPVLLLLLQGILIGIFAVFLSYDELSSAASLSNITVAKKNDMDTYFPLFKDIQLMLFVGLGLLLSFLKLYGFGAMAFNLVIANFSIQWAVLVQGFFYHYRDGKIHFGLENVMQAEFAAVTALISAGAILGRCSPVQLLLLSMLEIPLFVLNDWLINHYFHIIDIGGTVAIHVFSCYFGLGVSRILYRPGLRAGHSKNITTPTTDLLSLLGAIILWIFWPSFNSVLAKSAEAQHRAVLNTFLALSFSTLTTFALSSLMDKRGRINMVHLQNSILAGGVAVGASADMMITPAGASGLGCIAALSCILGFQYIAPFLEIKLKVQDQCGIHNLHGLPAILGTLGSILAILFERVDTTGHNLRGLITSDISIEKELFSSDTVEGNGAWNAKDQALNQAAALGVTFGVSLLGGYITGLILKPPCLVHPSDEMCFDDQPYFQIPTDSEETWSLNAQAQRELIVPLKQV